MMSVIQIPEEEVSMKNIKSEIYSLASHINPQTIRFAMLVVTLGLFVLAAGAPDAGGGITGSH
jgi:hypothetical protein